MGPAGGQPGRESFWRWPYPLLRPNREPLNQRRADRPARASLEPCRLPPLVRGEQGKRRQRLRKTPREPILREEDPRVHAAGPRRWKGRIMVTTRRVERVDRPRKASYQCG